MATFTCVNCGQADADDYGECFGHPEAEPGWPRFHTSPDEHTSPEEGPE